ncbi:hypothetical protein COCMIDRAFT_34854 [Bipolaris oryzae ATCC 44560]|uniref:LYC1 C-terminal domain-containing protein n=1 Tax=Bipolaris oryzae ATCC 44560 TaxID=930090 RepID=W6ZUX2_COCMI|nr:uncharacterized protein COCMIDRAFT_34854 [Bipolaris oryzae ATCC 44560]EUC47621.1 hypothetical protein COCMIDRAFT_34854 [Bipolaris oryzae ATCC 44560]
MNVLPKDDLPNSKSPDLVLRHPTEDECIAIWNNTSAEWIDSLTPPLYLKECRFLTTIPLARDGGMTTWVLVHKDSAPNKRHILCSCETFRKHSLTSNSQGEVSDNIIHGIASVFCAPPYRRRGYAGRMMQELAKELYSWQTDKFSCIGTTLYSDIGKEYYANLGWTPNITNSQVELLPKPIAWSPLVKAIVENDLDDICKRDEALVRFRMSVPADEIKKTRFTIIPNVDYMGWHIGKEQFATDFLFGKTPTAKGVIAGSPGKQVWATWVHRYYGPPNTEKSHNVLYILRLVVETDETATRLPGDALKRPEKDIYEEQIELLKAVLQAAQAEAAEWKLDAVQLWDPTPLVLGMLKDSGLGYTVIEREKDHIASLLWYDQQGGISKEQPLWVNNEHYAWQ